MSAPRLAVLCDYLEEGWPSMDLAATALSDALAASGSFAVERVQPAFRRRAMRVSSGRWAFNLDRFANRFVDYRRVMKGVHADVFHVADHSYAHLVHGLPAATTGVYCHDMDAFRSVLDRANEPRPGWFRALMSWALRGLQKAAVVFHSTEAVRSELLAHGVVDARRLVLAPYGTSAEFVPSSAAREDFLLHVGSCIPRKRIDVLLEVAARLERPLVQIGGDWTAEQRALLQRLGLRATQRRGLERSELASLYQRAALVLQPSEREGFGIPVAEALACGAPVLASDIPPLREVGAAAVTYAPVADVDAWVTKGRALLADPASAPPVAERLERARAFSWTEHARIVGAAYRRLLA